MKKYLLVAVSVIVLLSAGCASSKTIFAINNLCTENVTIVGTAGVDDNVILNSDARKDVVVKKQGKIILKGVLREYIVDPEVVLRDEDNGSDMYKKIKDFSQEIVGKMCSITTFNGEVKVLHPEPNPFLVKMHETKKDLPDLPAKKK